MDLGRRRVVRAPRLAPKVHAATSLEPRMQCWAELPLTRAWSPVCNGGLNLGFISRLHGVHRCMKQRRENARPVFLQGGGLWLPPCLRHQEPKLGRIWGSSPCRSLRPPGPQQDGALSTPLTPCSWAPGELRNRFLPRCSQMAGAVPRGTAGLFPPSLPLRPFPWRSVGNQGDLSCKNKNQETDSKEGVTCRLVSVSP